MAVRSPLFGLVRRSFRVARRSLATGVPPEDLVERARLAERRALPLTRRDLLRASAVTAAGLAAGCSLRGGRSRRGGPSAEVVVVGGGIAGLTAAYRLRQAGVAVRLLEAQSRVGGRIFSLRDHFPEGQVCELGGELIDTGHTAIRGLARELEIALDDLSTDDPSLVRDLWWFGGQARSEAEVARAFLPVARRIDADLATISGDVTYRTPSGAEALDRTPLEAWLASLSEAGAEPWFVDLLRVAYTTEYGLEPEEQSTLNLLLLIDPASGAGDELFRVFGESDERFRVHEGNDAIPRTLAERLGGVVELGVRLEAVREASDGSVVLSVRRGAASEEVRADHAVLALPFTLLRQIRLDLDLPPVKRRAIAELGYGTNAKLMAGFTERVWRTRHGSNGSVFAELPFQTTWETSRLQAGRAGILTNFTGGRHGVELGTGTAADQARSLAADLDRLYPGLGEAHTPDLAVRFHWPTSPYVLGSYASYLPGQWTGFGGAEGEPVRRLHFAGEHTSAEAQGFMEGGCESGERVAHEVLRDLGLATPAGAAA